MGNRNLNQARVNRNDEFYTQYSDIEAEMGYYKKHFKGKIVYMNCDDPRYSNFWKYFKVNFHDLGLKKIVSTYYILDEVAYKTEYDGYEEVRIRLRQNGNFLSSESIITLKESDIVVSNPPFSLFSRYVSQLLKFEKDFIILGNYGSITYKDIFTKVMEGEVGLGVNNGVKEFIVPEDAPVKSGQRVDSEGIKYQKFGNISWFTSLNHGVRNEKLTLTRKYEEGLYDKYEGYDVVNVDRITDIPKGYSGVMGVPITYYMKHDPEEFDILGIANDVRWIGFECLAVIGDRNLYERMLIRRRGYD